MPLSFGFFYLIDRRSLKSILQCEFFDLIRHDSLLHVFQPLSWYDGDPFTINEIFCAKMMNTLNGESFQKHFCDIFRFYLQQTTRNTFCIFFPFSKAAIYIWKQIRFDNKFAKLWKIYRKNFYRLCLVFALFCAVANMCFDYHLHVYKILHARYTHTHLCKQSYSVCGSFYWLLVSRRRVWIFCFAQKKYIPNALLCANHRGPAYFCNSIQNQNVKFKLLRH